MIKMVKNVGDFKIYARFGNKRIHSDYAPAPHPKDAQLWYLGKNRILIVQKNRPGGRFPYCVIHIHSNRESISLDRRVLYFPTMQRAEAYATKIVKK